MREIVPLAPTHFFKQVKVSRKDASLLLPNAWDSASALLFEYV